MTKVIHALVDRAVEAFSAAEAESQRRMAEEADESGDEGRE
jgi:hypothetical protein